MHQKPSQWTGRIDGETEEHLRWHQAIVMGEINTSFSDFGLIGFASDEGVRRNKGRVGARKGPGFLRKAYANFPIVSQKSLADYGDIVCENNALEYAQNELAEMVANLQRKRTKTIVFGGGHEVMFGHYSGLRLAFPDKKIGIINFDAHFDNRAIDPAIGASSGTGFWQIAQQDRNFAYLAIGIQANSNTKALFNEAERTNTQYILADEILPENQKDIFDKIDSFINVIDVLYVTLCLDVFAAPFAPGVSAAAFNGLIPDFFFKKIFKKVACSPKLSAFDIAELNPDLDIDNRTAKLAASFVFELVNV
ncbi:formimidoylglutamase [Lacihabitans sp. LS3-19]|uniref:formimidoylglutamase n=1 Tax=Lacihabitans sp. LS3-19 TaxID=2487335 RepID=UPI0020CE9DD5|nr:formimidoylglutamase [Lacihabitans sp. LS3-19]MCP9768383.1 formimidoylglutamase [Lacihabitans sp. LS3-19]